MKLSETIRSMYGVPASLADAVEALERENERLIGLCNRLAEEKLALKIKPHTKRDFLKDDGDE